VFDISNKGPGPGNYNPDVRKHVTGGFIRRDLIDEKRVISSPGPSDYHPKYRFVTKR